MIFHCALRKIRIKNRKSKLKLKSHTKSKDNTIGIEIETPIFKVLTLDKKGY